MRILHAHNRIGSSAPSGENVIVEWERELLTRRGHTVRAFDTSSDELRASGLWGAVKGGALTPWNPFAAAAIRRTADEFRPDIAHVHNTFPLLSPAVFHGLRGRAARVMTLHNYGLFCAGGLPLRDGRTCTKCIELRSVRPALRHGCYRQSRLATLPRAAGIALHRWLGTWRQHVDAFIALTEFQQDLLARAGLPAELIHIRPNFFPGKPAALPWAERRPCVVFAGRLTAEKGVDTLLEAWHMWGEDAPELFIVGDGAQRAQLESRATGRVSFVGHVPGNIAREYISSARLVVIPSQVYEGFPVVLQEAFAFGTPVAVSDVGPLPGLVRQGEIGLVFEGWSAASLLRCVRTAWCQDDLLRRLSSRGRETYERWYTDEASYAALQRIYQAALDVAAERK